MDDLPEALQIEILCRISCRKSVFRCTCVSKHWSTFISDPDFGRRYVRQHGNGIGALIASLFDSNIFIPLLEESNSTLDLNLNFLQPRGTIVVGTCNDLVLCFPFDGNNFLLGKQSEFYIYNPFTKQSFDLPPASHTYNYRYDNRSVGMGFICEYQNPSNTDSIECRWSVVRFGLRSCHMDIFSSETGEWRHLQRPDPELQPLLTICDGIHEIRLGSTSTGGIACNGRLYWVVTPDYTVIEVDPFNVTINLFNLPFEDSAVALGKQGGYLRCCKKWVADDINVWELREEEDKAICKPKKWCSVVDGVSLAQMVSKSKDPLITDAPFRFRPFIGRQVLGFHPTNENVLCLDFVNCIAKCNFRARTLERIPGDCTIPIVSTIMVNPLVLPWRPTPVPS